MADNLKIVSSVEEAIRAKNAFSAYLAGGTEINRLNSYVNAKTLISLKNIPQLKDISKNGNIIKIGSLVTFQDLIENDYIPQYLKDAARFMASRTKRNMATVGGNIAILRSDSYLLSALCACSAKLTLNSNNEVDIKEYVSKYFNYKNMLITSIQIDTSNTVYVRRFSNTAQSHASITIGLGLCKDKYSLFASIKNFGNINLESLAKKLSSSNLSEDEIISYIKTLPMLDKLNDDLFGSKEYKKYLLGVGISELYNKFKGGEINDN